MTTPADKPLTAELERAALRAVRAEYIAFNDERFQSQLLVPPLMFVDTRARLGAWVPEPRSIELSRGLLSEHGWGALVEVLKHEMAHQFVDEVLGAVGESAHGASFKRVCVERGIDPRSRGVPDGVLTGDGDSGPGRVLERVAKLLALAESGNRHEAESAANAAQRLMLKYNLDWVHRGEMASYSFRHVGRATGRVSEHERLMATLLDEHFFVDAIWVPVWRPQEGRAGSILELCGSATNLEIAAYVYDFLLGSAERLWRQQKAQQGISGNRDRRAFLAGVMLGFEERLERERQSHSEEGLVWVGDPLLRRFFRSRHPRVRTVRRESTGSATAREQGRAQGRDIVLRRGMTRGPSGGRPKQLGPG